MALDPSQRVNPYARRCSDEGAPCPFRKFHPAEIRIAEELDAQAETLKDLVAKLRLLVDGQVATVSPPSVSSQRLLPKSTPAITGRRMIPMPEESDDSNFRNF